MKPVLSPYQQSVLARLSKTRLDRWFGRTVQWLLVSLLAYGVFLDYQDQGNPALEGWLYLGVILYAVWVWFFVGILVFIRLIMGAMRLARQFVSETGPLKIESYEAGQIVDESDKLRRKSEAAFEKLLENTKIMGAYKNLGFIAIDATIDWSLICLLVTANHPIYALLVGSGVCLQYLLIRSCQNMGVSYIASLDDPLGSDGVVDVDDLMDKLCHGEDK